MTGAGFQKARTVVILPPSLQSITSTPSKVVDLPFRATALPVHFTAAEFPLMKTWSSVSPTELNPDAIPLRN